MIGGHMEQRDPNLDNWLDGIDLSTAPEDEAVLTEPVDFKALLLRRFTWDTQMCSEVAELLPKLGLTLSTPEGTDHEHAESHHRMAAVLPFEGMLREYASVLSAVLTTAVTEASGVADKMSPEDSLGFARQNAELILSGSRAVLAQLFFTGLLTYGPGIQITRVHVGEDGQVVVDQPAAEPAADAEVPGQLSFGDLEPGSDIG